MTELNMAVEALKLCVGQEAFAKAMEQVKVLSAPQRSGVVDLKTLREIIQDLLLKVGVPTHIKGFAYLETAIRLIVEKPDIVDSITKELYPQVGKIHGTSGIRTERAMRHGIEVAFNRGDLSELDSLFGNSISRHKGKPTNSEFLTRMAMIVRRELEQEQ